jgi:hypothetical protein
MDFSFIKYKCTKLSGRQIQHSPLFLVLAQIISEKKDLKLPWKAYAALIGQIA